MFTWLSRWWYGTKTFPEPESLRFVKGVCNNSYEPKIYTRWSLGYMYHFEMIFQGGIKIDLSYNQIRSSWDMSIWSNHSLTHLYYYDWSLQAANYLIERYGLLEKLNKALEEKKEKDRKQDELEQETKDKYLKEKHE